MKARDWNGKIFVYESGMRILREYQKWGLEEEEEEEEEEEGEDERTNL